MSIEDLDLAILSFVADNPSSTVTDTAKELFHPDDIDELRRRDTMLRHCCKNLWVRDLLRSEKSGNRTLFIASIPGRWYLVQVYRIWRLVVTNGRPPIWRATVA